MREWKLHPTLQLVSEAVTIGNRSRLLGTISKVVIDEMWVMGQLGMRGKYVVIPGKMCNAHKRNECSVNKVRTEAEGVVARHRRRGTKLFLSMSVGWLQHYLLSTTSGLPKNIARKEQPFVWGEEHKTFRSIKIRSKLKVMESWQGNSHSDNY